MLTKSTKSIEQNIILIILFLVYFVILIFPSLCKLLGYIPSKLFEGDTFQVYDVRRVAMLIPLLIFPFVLVYSSKVRAQFFNILGSLSFITRLLLMLLVVFMLIGSILSIAPIHSVMVSSEQILLIIFALFIAAIAYNNPLFKKLLYICLLIISAMYVIESLVLYFWYINSGIKHNEFISGLIYLYLSFANPRFFAQYITWVLPVLSIPLFLNINKSIKLLILFIVCYFWMLAIASGTRSILFEWLLLFLLSPIIFNKHAINYLLINLISLVIGLILATSFTQFNTHDAYKVIMFVVIYAVVLLLYYCYSRVAGSYKKWFVLCVISVIAVLLVVTSLYFSNLMYSVINNNGRFGIWSNTFYIFMQHEWLGVGSGLLPLYGIIISENGSSTIIAQPHNILLRLLAENGIFAFICIVIPIVRGVINMLRRLIFDSRTNAFSWYRLGLFSVLVCAVFHSQTSGLMEMPLSQLTGAILIGLMIAEFQKIQVVESSNKLHKIQIYFLSVVLAFSAYLIISTIYSLKNISNVNNSRQCADEISPFYWFDGSAILDYPGEYFCLRNYPELKYWSIYGPYKVRFKSGK